VIGTGVGDDGIPDDGGVVGIVGARPVRCYVYEELLCVPCEERGEICFQREANDGVLFLLRRVVVGTAFYTIDCAKANWLESSAKNKM
jgi:hypothetical protein